MTIMRAKVSTIRNKKQSRVSLNSNKRQLNTKTTLYIPQDQKLLAEASLQNIS